MRILAVDSGTTTTRVWIVDDGTVLQARSTRIGARDVARDSTRGTILESISHLARELFDELGCSWDAVDAVVAFGMITSELGLEEIPHLPAPVTARTIAAHVQHRDYGPDIPVPTYLIPGVRWDSGHGAELSDFMRGEETEVVGLLQLADAAPPLLYISPGSHTKFVAVGEGGEILWSFTTLSGELIWSLSQETILAGLLNTASAEDHPEMVRRGGAFAESCGLTRAFYAARLMNRLEHVSPAACSAYVHGAVAATDLNGLQSLHERLAVPLPPHVRITADGGLGGAYLTLLADSSWFESVVPVRTPLGPAGAWVIFDRHRQQVERSGRRTEGSRA